MPNILCKTLLDLFYYFPIFIFYSPNLDTAQNEFDLPLSCNHGTGYQLLWLPTCSGSPNCHYEQIMSAKTAEKTFSICRPNPFKYKETVVILSIRLYMSSTLRPLWRKMRTTGTGSGDVQNPTFETVSLFWALRASGINKASSWHKCNFNH